MSVASQDLEDRLLAVFNRVFHTRLKPHELVVDQVETWDSLTHIKLIMALEAAFQVHIDPRQIRVLYQDFAMVHAYMQRVLSE